MSLHHKYSASGADRWLKCPGSIQLSENAPPEEESKYAMEGTKAHLALYLILKAFLKNGRPRVAAAVMSDFYPAKLIEHAMECFKRVEARLTPDAILLNESRVTVPGVGFGTLDVGIVEEFGELTIMDYKYGAGVAVEVEDNIQLQYYAIGACEDWHWSFERVRLVIDQPRAYHSKGLVRETMVSIGELQAMKKKLQEGVKKCEEPKPKLRAGDHCRWCKAITICPEVNNLALRSAQDDFKNLK
jgi:hypothetical protein